MTYTTPSRGLRDGMNNSDLWLTLMTLSHELKALDAMNSIGLWQIYATPTREFKAVDFINNSTLWMI